MNVIISSIFVLAVNYFACLVDVSTAVESRSEFVDSILMHWCLAVTYLFRRCPTAVFVCVCAVICFNLNTFVGIVCVVGSFLQLFSKYLCCMSGLCRVNCMCYLLCYCVCEKMSGRYCC